MEHNASADQVYFALLKMDIMDQLTSDLINKTVLLAASIAAICFVCSLAHNFSKNSFKSLFSQDTSEFPNYMEIGRGMLMIICIASYPAIAQVLATTVDFFNQRTSPTLAISEQAANLQAEGTKTMTFTWEDRQEELLKNAANSKATTAQEQADKEYAAHTVSKGDAPKDSDVNSQGIKSALSDLGSMLNPLNLTSLCLQVFAHMIVGIIHVIVAGFAVIMFKILLIIGPLAFAFSILPCFEKQLSTWFGTLLNVGFVFTTLNIIEHITCAVYTLIYSKGSSQGYDPMSILCLDLVIICSTCSCFWITSKFVGKGDGGRVLSKLVSTAAGTATLIAGAAAAKGGNVASAASIGSTIIKNN